MSVSERAMLALYDAIMEANAEAEDWDKELRYLEQMEEAFQQMYAGQYHEWKARQPVPDEVMFADWIDALTGGNERGR